MRTAPAMFSVALMAFALAIARAASAQVYLPNNNQWKGENVYQGAELILAYDNGNARTFTPEQVTLFNMTSGWLSGATQMLVAVGTLDPTAHGSRCLMHLNNQGLVDVARAYANYWTQHPDEHNTYALSILIRSMHNAGPCK